VTLLPGFPYNQATVSMAGSAYFWDLGKFLAEFENRFPYARIQNLSWNPPTAPATPRNGSAQFPDGNCDSAQTQQHLTCTPRMKSSTLVSWSGNVAVGRAARARLSGRRQPGGQHWHQCAGAVHANSPCGIYVTSSPVKDPFIPTTRLPVPVGGDEGGSGTGGHPGFGLPAQRLSGPSYARLATINNRTVAVGEDAEVTTANGKIKIHCVDIKEFSVTILAANQAEVIELKLRRSLQ